MSGGKDSFFSLRATIQNNLGSALQTLGSVRRGTARLEEAVAVRLNQSVCLPVWRRKLDIGAQVKVNHWSR